MWQWLRAIFGKSEPGRYVEEIQVLAPEKPMDLPPVKPLKAQKRDA